MIALVTRQRRASRRSRGTAAALAAVAAVATSAAVVAPANAESAAPGAPIVTRLSDGRTRSQWAYPTSAALVRAEPSTQGRVVGRLRFLTSDNQAELYICLASAQLPSGETWI